MISIQDLKVVYQNEVIALQNISLEINKKCTVIIGMNGSGKSTLLTTLVGLHPYEGRIVINELEEGEQTISTIRQRVGMVFQNPDDQLFMSTIYDDLAFGLINMGIEPKERVEKIAEEFSFKHLLNRSSHKLSGGQKRIAALMSVLVMEPDIILMDEPTSFLDPKSRRTVIDYIRMCDQQLVVSTHDLDMAYEIADEVIIINEGKIIAQGDKDLLLKQELLEENGLELPFMFQKPSF